MSTDRTEDPSQAAAERPAVDWYEQRHSLRPGMVFTCRDGSIVQLDRSVPGDATRWYVLYWDKGWFGYDSTIEPGDLVEQHVDGQPVLAPPAPARGGATFDPLWCAELIEGQLQKGVITDGTHAEQAAILRSMAAQGGRSHG